MHKKGLLSKVFTHTFETLKRYPLIYAPFTIFVVIEVSALLLLYNIPRAPLHTAFGPPIKTFWGEKFLHYPYNFLLLPKLSYYSKMVLSVVLGSLLIGMALALIQDIRNKKPLRLLKAFKTAIMKYVSFFAVILMVTAVYVVLEKTLTFGLVKYFLSGHKKLLFIKAHIWLGPLLPALSFFLAVMVQSLFAYCLPALIIGNKKLLSSLVNSCVLFVKHFIPTVIIVGLPMCAFIPILVLTYHTAFLITKFFPECVLYVLIGGVIVNSLVIDLLITVSTAHAYLEITDTPSQTKAVKDSKNE